MTLENEVDFEPGQVLGSWILEKRLGRGGQASVFAARDRTIPDLRAALKIFVTKSAEERNAVIHEAQVLTRIHHACVLRPLGFGEDDERGVLFLATELVPGETLEARLKTGPLVVEEASVLFAQLFQALETVHASGLAHRDVKPGNIMVRPNGVPCLIDFGIALGHGLHRGDDFEWLTPRYAAPEQLVEGIEGAAPIDPRAADVFSLGQCLVEALTGALAFPEDSAAVLLRKRAMATGLDPGNGFPDALREVARGTTAPFVERWSAARASGSLQQIARESGTQRMPRADSNGLKAESPRDEVRTTPSTSQTSQPKRSMSWKSIAIAGCLFAAAGFFVGAVASYAFLKDRVDQMLASMSGRATTASPTPISGPSATPQGANTTDASTPGPTDIPVDETRIDPDTFPTPIADTGETPLPGSDASGTPAAARTATPQSSKIPESVIALGGLRITPSDAFVQVDGTHLGAAKDLVSRRLIPGRHTVEVFKDGMRSARLIVEVDPRGTLRILEQ